MTDSFKTYFAVTFAYTSFTNDQDNLVIIKTSSAKLSAEAPI